METNKIIIIACAVIVGILYFYILSRKNFQIIKDPVDIPDPPFSLSRSQMAFWTLILMFSIFYVWFDEGTFITLDGTILGLIGISAGTTIGGYYLDKRDAGVVGGPIHQQTNSSKNFFLNICSDGNGLSIHRFQNVIFTIIIGFYVVYKVMEEGEFPEINNNMLLLLGISSATYLAIKQDENKPSKAVNKASKKK